VALDRAKRQNGCLKVLVGSHRAGRIEHGAVGSQHGANPDRVAELAKRLELRYLEVDPGTAVFFHCNTLHSSEANLSQRARTSFICCYNALSNAPATPSTFHGQPESITLASDDAILKGSLVGT
jgi:ectoine hydroxylase